jgi:hypothetical protein
MICMARGFADQIRIHLARFAFAIAPARKTSIIRLMGDGLGVGSLRHHHFWFVGREPTILATPGINAVNPRPGEL